MDVTLETNEARIPRRSHSKLARRFISSLRRLSTSVRKMHVSLKLEKNGGKGDNKVCQIQLFMKDGRQIFVREKQARFGKAMTNGIRRTKRLVAQQTGRQRRVRRSDLSLPVVGAEMAAV